MTAPTGPSLFFTGRSWTHQAARDKSGGLEPHLEPKVQHINLPPPASLSFCRLEAIPIRMEAVAISLEAIAHDCTSSACHIASGLGFILKNGQLHKHPDAALECRNISIH